MSQKINFDTISNNNCHYTISANMLCTYKYLIMTMTMYRQYNLAVVLEGGIKGN